MRFSNFLKNYEKTVLLILIFSLVFLIRLVFFVAMKDNPEAGETVEFSHTFLEEPFTNSYYQYFYWHGVLVTLERFPEYHYGDKILVRGVVEEVVSRKENDLLKRLAIKNPELKKADSGALAVVKVIRQKVLSVYKRTLPQKEAGLLSGIVLGAGEGINKAFNDELKTTGMLHVVVASGSNVVLVSGMLFSLISSIVKRNYAILFTILGIFFYALLTGFDSPVVRASIMASFAFGAQIFGRQKTALMALFFSGFFMLLVSPGLIVDIGFQLSFSATLGIILFQKTISRLSQILPNIIKEDFSTTIAAQIGSSPFLLFAFGKINLLSIFINLILLWTIPIIMIFGGAAGVAGLVFPVLSVPILYICYPFLLLFTNVVSFMSHFTIPISLTGAFFPITVLYYIILVAVLFRRKNL